MGAECEKCLYDLNDDLDCKFCKSVETNTRLEEENEKLRKALRFYGKRENYYWRILLDEGKKAREVLKGKTK